MDRQDGQDKKAKQNCKGQGVARQDFSPICKKGGAETRFCGSIIILPHTFLIRFAYFRKARPICLYSRPMCKRALSVRQPYVEQIMRGEKVFEFRSGPTKIRERVYIYASLTPGDIEDWEEMNLRPGDLPTGVSL